MDVPRFRICLRPIIWRRLEFHWRNTRIELYNACATFWESQRISGIRTIHPADVEPPAGLQLPVVIQPKEQSSERP